MTYKELVDRFKQVADQHYMIKDFGYGLLSDIKVHSQDGEADYPYMFLNYTTHQRSGTVMTYNFNLIMMDIATDEDDDLSNYTAIQSKCQQYIDDVIAELYYGYTDKPEIDYSNVTYTPFKERFQDTVAGMTATISIEVPTPINRCIAPFPTNAPEPPIPTPISIEVTSFAASNEACNNGAVTFRVSGGSLPQVLEYNGNSYNITNVVGTIIQTSNETEGTRPWTITEADGTVHTGEVTVICTYVPPTGCVPVVSVFSIEPQGFNPDDGGLPPIECQLIALSNGGWREDIPGIGRNYYTPQSANPITWTITGTVLMEAVNPGDVINPFVIQEIGSSTLIQPTTLTGWPLNNTAPPVGSEFTFEATYRIVTFNQNRFQLAVNPDTPDPQARFAILSGTNVQICEDGATPPEPRGTTLVVVANNLDQPFDLNQAGVSSLGWVSEDYYFNDGYWNGFDYRPQTTDPYRWVLSGRVQFNSPGEIVEFQIYDPVEGTNTPPTSSNWPTNPTIGQVYDFELVWEGVTPTVDTFYQSLYVNKVPSTTMAEFTILGGTNPTGSVLNIYLED